MRSIQLLWVAVAGLLGLMAQSAQAQTQPAPPLSSESYYGQIFTSEEIGRLEALARSVRENRDLRQQGVRLVAEAENLRRLAQMETRARRQRRGMKRAEQTQQQADQTLAQALRGIYQAQGEIFVLYANKAEAEYDKAATRELKRQGEEYERAAFDWLDNQARPAFESGEKATTEATRQQQWAQADSLQQKALLSMENAFRRYRGQPPYDPGRPFVDEDVRSAEEVRTAIDSLSRVNPSSTGWLDAVRRIEESARRLRQQAEGSDNPAVQNVLGQQIRELESQAQASLGESVQFRLNQNLERYQDYQYRFRGVNPTEADLQKEPVKAARALELAGWALFNDAKAKILSASASTGNHASLFLLQSDDIERRAMQKLDSALAIYRIQKVIDEAAEQRQAAATGTARGQARPAAARPAASNTRDLSTLGITFKVQVGSFRAAPDMAQFNGLPGITTDRSPDGQWTRYYSGEFSLPGLAEERAALAKAKGFPDAFVVGYRRGARQADYLPLKAEVDAFLLGGGTRSAAAPAAAPATAANAWTSALAANPALAARPVAASSLHATRGLVYTVQVGAFKTPVKHGDLANVSPIYTANGPNGFTRYCAGIFPSLVKATAEKNRALGMGLPDAVVRAYFDGQEITLDQARAREGAGASQPVEPAAGAAASAPAAAPVAGLSFSVQALAYQDGKVSAEALAQLRQKVGAQAAVTQQPADSRGIVAVTVGSYATEAQANQMARQLATQGYPDCFPVAFKDGRKMTVSEARELRD